MEQSSNFSFDEEVRSGYLVSSNIKKLWYKQIELLQIFIKICEKYNLKYSLYAGNLLGVARHKGYIPWDDDLDVAMLRADYDKFIKVATDELPKHVFLQTSLTDKSWPLIGYAKLRNSQTAAIQDYYVERKAKINQGIFIDIFPLDYIYSDENKREIVYKRYAKKARVYSYALRDKYYVEPNKFNFLKLNFLRLANYAISLICKTLIFFNGGYAKYQFRMDDIFRNLPSKDCDSICDCTFCARANPHAKVYNREWYESEYIDMPFEFLSVKIPKEYDEILKRKFGDWHQMVQGTSFHSFNRISTTECYKDILIKEFGYKETDF